MSTVLTVIRNHKKEFNIIDSDDNILLPFWSSKIWEIDDYFYIKHDNSWNVMDSDGKLLSSEWFKQIKEYDNKSECFVVIRKNGTMNWLQSNGDILSEVWYQYVSNFDSQGISRVSLTDKWNLFSRDTKSSTSVAWFDYVGELHDGLARVWSMQQGKYNFMSADGILYSPLWYTDATEFSNGKAKVDYKGAKISIGSPFVNPTNL